MAKNLKLTIKNAQIAEAINLGGLKNKLGKKEATAKEEPSSTGAEDPKETPKVADSAKDTAKKTVAKAAKTPEVPASANAPKEDAPKIKARSKSVFAEGSVPPESKTHTEDAFDKESSEDTSRNRFEKAPSDSNKPLAENSGEELRKRLFGIESKEDITSHAFEPHVSAFSSSPEASPAPTFPSIAAEKNVSTNEESRVPPKAPELPRAPLPRSMAEGVRREPTRDPVRDAPRNDGPRNEGPRHEGPRREGPSDNRAPDNRSGEQRPYMPRPYEQRPYDPRNSPPRGDYRGPNPNYRGPDSRSPDQRGPGPGGPRGPSDRPPYERRPDSPQGNYRPQGDRPPYRPGGPSSGYQGNNPSGPSGGYQGNNPNGPSGGYPPRDPNYRPPQRLGPTGRHVNDLFQARPRPPGAPGVPFEKQTDEKTRTKPKPKSFDQAVLSDKKGPAAAKVKEFRDVKPAKKGTTTDSRFDSRDRQGLRESSDDQVWRKRRQKAHHHEVEDLTIRPTSLKIRIPISIKDLAVEMKLKASQIVSKLFLQGMVVTLNDLLDDETTLHLIGAEFGCEIKVDTEEEDRIRITKKAIREEIGHAAPEDLVLRAPVVAFMGHVDHGKTSLIDAIRKTNRAAGEAGAITQHIGAFRCQTAVGDISILDTPGHEAFSAMRARGAVVTDIVVLVVAGDEGIRQQTVEAIQHAKAAGVTIVVAINKADKPNFNPENVYRQLSEQELLPESWGGQTITVNCSAVTGEGIPQLLEMLALQAEVLELRANPKSRARGTVIESEMHKGLGSVATVLVQNGTLKKGDAVVFDEIWGRVKTMHNEFGEELQEAIPSTPVEITGLSGLPEAGQEFIVVKSEKEAREISEARAHGNRQNNLMQKKKISMESLFQQASDSNKKILNVVLRADVQGSLEAMKVALMKIESKKADLNIIFAGVGEVSESDVTLASASKAIIIGFHTQIEGHADALIKQLGIQVKMHDIIYHAVDDVKVMMAGLLDKIAIETEKGKAEIRATFKSSQHGIIAGCQVIEGTIQRSNYARLLRGKDIVWKGTIASLKRVKEDVREVSKGLECGILLNNFDATQVGDIIEAYEINYITQEL